MWTRALLKANAKDILRRSYWRVFLACLIVSLLCGGDFNLNYRFGADSAPSGLPEGAASIAGSAGFPFSALVPLLLPIILGVGVFALLLLLAAVLCWGILVTPVIQVGQARYLTENRSGPASLGVLFSGFTRGYWNTVGVMFFHEPEGLFVEPAAHHPRHRQELPVPLHPFPSGREPRPDRRPRL